MQAFTFTAPTVIGLKQGEKEKEGGGEDAARGHHSWEEWEAACALESTAGHEIKKETTTANIFRGNALVTAWL